MKITKKRLPWRVLIQSTAVMLIMYTIGVLVLTAAISGGIIRSVYYTYCITTLSFSCGLFGGFLFVDHLPWGSTASSALIAVSFDLALLLVGFCWEGLALTGEGISILAFGLIGGLTSGLIGTWKARVTHRKNCRRYL